MIFRGQGKNTHTRLRVPEDPQSEKNGVGAPPLNARCGFRFPEHSKGTGQLRVVIE